MILETVVVGPMQVNCYILASKDSSRAILIDPGDQAYKIEKALQKHHLQPSMIINTHGHYDHIGCDNKFGVPVFIHSADAAMLKDPMLNLSGLFALPYQAQVPIRELKDKDSITLDGIELEVMYTPGHTPGGISLLLKKPAGKIVFTGDTLFCLGVGRTDFTGGDEALLKESITKLFLLSDDTAIYPGHGETSSIGAEKKSNPFLM
jgi:glyoxylase-like metal-dependent hydrolase (beta-lactamase superfamily II)